MYAFVDPDGDEHLETTLVTCLDSEWENPSAALFWASKLFHCMEDRFLARTTRWILKHTRATGKVRLITNKRTFQLAWSAAGEIAAETAQKARRVYVFLKDVQTNFLLSAGRVLWHVKSLWMAQRLNNFMELAWSAAKWIPWAAEDLLYTFVEKARNLLLACFFATVDLKERIDGGQAWRCLKIVEEWFLACLLEDRH